MRDRGFTVIEVLVAVLVLATGMTIFLNLLQSGVHVEKESRNITHAVLIGESIINELTNSDLKNPPPQLLKGKKEIDKVEYIWNTEIQWDSQLPNTAVVNCNVGWNSDKIRQQRLTTILRQK